MRYLIALFICGAAACGGDMSVGVDVDNENQQSQNGSGASSGSSAEACEACLGNTADDMSDRECLEGYGLTPEDC
jgi:hypothetical protein